MKCPNCGNDMVQSRAGWLCLSCGHAEINQGTPSAADSKIATGKESHDQMSAAAKAQAGEDQAPAPIADSKPPDDTADSIPKPDAIPANPVPPWADVDSDSKSKPADQPKSESDAESQPPTDSKTDQPDNPGKLDKSSDKGGSDDLQAIQQAVAEAATETPPAADAAKPDEPHDDSATEHKTEEPSESQPESSNESSPKPKPEADVAGHSEDGMPGLDVKPVEAGPEPASSADPATASSLNPTPEPSPDLPNPGPETPPSAAPQPGEEPVSDPKPSASSDVPSVDKPGTLPDSPLPAPPEAAPPSPEPETTASAEPKTEASAPATAPGESDAPPPAAQTTAGPPPPGDKPPLKPETHPKHRKFHLFGMIVLAVLALGVSGSAVYAVTIAPKTAFDDYLLRLGNSKTLAFSTTINSAESGYRYALKLSGNADFHQASAPKVSATISGDVTTPGSTANTPVTGQLTADLVSAGQNLYFKLTSLSLRSQIVGLGPSSNWYSLNLKSSSGSQCLAQGTGAGSLINPSIISAIPVTSASLIGLGWLDGTPALHYHGAVTTSQLPTAGLSADCQGLASALRSTHLSYDVWRSWSKDRLELAVNSATGSVPTTMLLDTGNYNRPVAITTPASAEDAANLLTNVLGAATVAPGIVGIAAHATPVAPKPTPLPAGPTESQVNADLAAYLAAYRNTGGAGYFATNPPAVTVSASQTYTVVTTKPTASGQLYYQAGGACSGPAHVPGRTATRYLALTTLLNGSPVCLDSSQ